MAENPPTPRLPLSPHLRVELIYGPSQGSPLYRNATYWTPVSGNVTPTNIAAIADGFQATFRPLYAAVLSNEWKFFGVMAYWWDGSGTAYEAPNSDTSGGIGEIEDSQILPAEDNVVIRRKSRESGRNRRGRIFITGIPESFTAPGEQLTPAAALKYRQIASKLKGQQTYAGVQLNALTPDYKNGEFAPALDTQLVLSIRSRRDRRIQKRAVVENVIGV